MRKHLTPDRLGATVLAQLVPCFLLLVLSGCGGSSPRTNIVSPPPPGPPAISGLSAKSGLVGWTVQILGSNFGASQGSSTVTFNGTAATTVSIWTDTAIVAKVPSGATSGKVVVTVGGTASNGVSFNVITTLPSGSIQASAFGFQCSPNQNACPNEAWPSSIAQPGTLRLWDSGTFWNDIENTAPGVYTWTTLDGWLDTIAAQNSSNAWGVPVDVIYTFGFVACQEIAACRSGGAGAPGCGSQLGTFKGCIYPPDDFTGTLTGSLSFTNFVTALVNHCSAKGNCVKTLIKNYELWNEPNNPFFWHDTSTTTGELQIYQMVYPVVPIIRAAVGQNAVIMTMASTADPVYTKAWLAYEGAHAPILSDVVVWHQYLNVGKTEVAPEDTNNQSTFEKMLAAQTGVTGWTLKPFRITETGFQAYNTPYGCDTTIFSTNDCIGQMVRWQLIVLSNGGQGLDWYTWNVNIGSQPSYAQAWYFMMQHAVGGTFTGPCAVGGDGVTWTCPFTEADGTTQAQWVWTTSASGGSYTAPSGYADYVSLDLTSLATTTTNISGAISITTMPILLEQ